MPWYRHHRNSIAIGFNVLFNNIQHAAGAYFAQMLQKYFKINHLG